MTFETVQFDGVLPVKMGELDVKKGAKNFRPESSIRSSQLNFTFYTNTYNHEYLKYLFQNKSHSLPDQSHQ